jgi:polyisoprenoid-binding protein YceI
MALNSARLSWLLALLAVACAKKPPPPHRTAPWLANPSASATVNAGAPHTFHFSAGSSVRFSVAGRKGKLSGHAPVSGGSLRLDPLDLKSASANLDVDLTKLSVNAEGASPDGAPPADAPLGGSSASVVALQWLELGSEVPADRRAQFATARFELASVDNPQGPLLNFGAARLHPVRATATGTLLLHGFKEPIRADVLLEPQKTAPGAPLRLSIRSAGALVIALAPHDISARTASGIIDAPAMARSADWVGKNARIEFELVAEAESVEAK